MFYSYNFEIDSGKRNEVHFRESNKTPDEGKTFAELFFSSGRNITDDSWFTRLNLVNELKRKKKSYVGTVRKILEKYYQMSYLLLEAEQTIRAFLIERYRYYLGIIHSKKI